MGMIDVPEVFRPPPCFEYPRYNTITFEEYFRRYFLQHQPETDRVYLPVLWSVLYYRRHYRRDGMQDLQDYLNRLDPGVPYFTVCAYDGGTHERTDHLDLQVFSSIGTTISVDMASHMGNVGDRAIPLVCTPAPGIDLGRRRDVLAGFIGAKTHPVREMLWDALAGQPGFEVLESIVSPVCGFEAMDQDKWARVGYDGFKDLMERSVFALCPRGSADTSFRLMESLQYGCVPVYVSDRFWFPWSDPKDPSDHGMFDEIGITCLPEEIPDLPHRLREMPRSTIDQYLRNGRELYQDYFSPEGCAARIVEEVSQVVGYWRQAHRDQDADALTGTSLHGHLEFLKTSLPPSGKILCVGVGDGVWVKEIDKRYPLNGHPTVWSLDIVQRSLTGISSVVDSAMLPPGYFDLAMSLWVSPHMDDDQLARQMRDVVSSLTNDGVFAVHYNEPLDPEQYVAPACVGTMKSGTVLRTRDKFASMVGAAGGILEIVDVQPRPRWNMQMVAAHIRRRR